MILSRETRFSGANVDKGKLLFSSKLTTSRLATLPGWVPFNEQCEPSPAQSSNYMYFVFSDASNAERWTRIARVFASVCSAALKTSWPLTQRATPERHTPCTVLKARSTVVGTNVITWAVAARKLVDSRREEDVPP